MTVSPVPQISHSAILHSSGNTAHTFSTLQSCSKSRPSDLYLEFWKSYMPMHYVRCISSFQYVAVELRKSFHTERLTSVVSLTLASVWPTTALRAFDSRLPTKEEEGMSSVVVARPATAGQKPMTLTRRKHTTTICREILSHWPEIVSDTWTCRSAAGSKQVVISEAWGHNLFLSAAG